MKDLWLHRPRPDGRDYMASFFVAAAVRRWMTHPARVFQLADKASWSMIGLCLIVASVSFASPVDLMDGLMLERHEGYTDSAPDMTPEPRRPVESLFRAPPDTLSLDILPTEVPTTTDDEVARRRRAAEMHVNERRWESALREYRQLIRLQPGHLPYVERAALVATLAGQYASADAYYRDIIQVMPNHVNYLAAWGNILIRLMRTDEAQDVLQRALDLNPDHLMAQHSVLLLKSVRGESVDSDFWAYRTFREIVEVSEWMAADASEWNRLLGPDYFDRVVRTSLGGLSAEHLSEFNRLMRNALEYVRREEWRSAHDLLTRAQDLGADLPFLQLERIRCLVEMGELREGVRLVESLVAAHRPTTELRYGYAFIMIKAGEYERAITALEKLVVEHPEDRPEIRFALACAYAGAGRLDEAWPILTALAETHPRRFPDWMAGDAEYLRAIRADPRYGELTRMVAR